MKKLVVLTGAGISAESGIRTFREMGGLWEEYDVIEVASPQAWDNNPQLVNDFYNARRKQLYEVEPNNGHKGLVELEKYFDVQIVTQNVDNLHERAGSSSILHLHGELNKVRSTGDPDLIYELDGWELKIGDTCEKGFQLRPHIVWFGEPVPAIANAAPLFKSADVCAVIGTSLNVYPAAGLLRYLPKMAEIYLVDPNDTMMTPRQNTVFIKEKAGTGVKKLKEMLVAKYL
ncbi:MAG: NAD-dependent deacylase [Bacteroidales bacterium]|nr:NAD-dependent deacylase [Bacteroidales bacterium]MCF8457724.1 NAD-dependent deacylase [Bacteroidales bacterium]